MYGHGPIFEFTDYPTKSLKKAVELYEKLEDIGLNFVDEEVMREIQEELEKREVEKEKKNANYKFNKKR